MAAEGEQIIGLFASFQKMFDSDQEVRDTVKIIEQFSREIITLLQIIHLEKNAEQLSEVLNKVELLIVECSKCYEKLGTIIPKGEFYKYHDHWRSVTQRLVFEITLLEFIASGELATRDKVAERLSLKVEHAAGFHLDLEDYLHGLLQLISELSRLAVTSATAGNYNRPIQIANFVNELNAGFRLINFKNDSLRKRYDVLKYDLKKIEEVVYDLSIRGLKPKDAAAVN